MVNTAKYIIIILYSVNKEKPKKIIFEYIYLKNFGNALFFINISFSRCYE